MDGHWEVSLVINDLPGSRTLLDQQPPALELMGDEGVALLDGQR